MSPMQANSAPPRSPRTERLTDALKRAFAPTVLRVVDDSARHAGHAGHSPAGETHYDVLVVSEAFRDRSKVERSRAVHRVLEAEFSAGMHALSLTLRTPEEHDRTFG